MPTKLQTLNLLAPGFLGLNTSQKSTEELGWAQSADNCIIDGNGRLAARKGWTAVTTTPLTGTPDIESLHEYLDTGGTSTMISAASAKLYSGISTLTDITGSLTPTNDSWRFQNFNGKVTGFQDGETPIVYNGSGTFGNISFAYPSVGTNTFSGAGLAAFGRLWSTDSTKTVLKYSDLLIETSWTADDGTGGDSGGSAGVIDLKSVWVYGMDQVEAIQEFNGFLIIFGKRNIIVYTGPSDPATMSIQDTVEGTGCISRHTVQNVGTDILFLSNSGLRSFRKTIQEKSMPLNDISKNVRGDLLGLLSSETISLLRSVYHEKDGFYILNFPGIGYSYVFDIRQPLQDGSFRVTTWSSVNPKAMTSSRDGELYFGQAGVIGKYINYSDNGFPYTLTYYSPWMTMGTQQAPWMSQRKKFPKRMVATVTGGNTYELKVQIFYDYSTAPKTTTVTIDTITNAAEWGTSEWGLGEWSGGTPDSNVRVALFGAGNTIQLGLVVPINGQSISFQRLELYTKLGNLG